MTTTTGLQALGLYPTITCAHCKTVLMRKDGKILYGEQLHDKCPICKGRTTLNSIINELLDKKLSDDYIIAESYARCDRLTTSIREVVMTLNLCKAGRG